MILLKYSTQWTASFFSWNVLCLSNHCSFFYAKELTPLGFDGQHPYDHMLGINGWPLITGLILPSSQDTEPHMVPSSLLSGVSLVWEWVNKVWAAKKKVDVLVLSLMKVWCSGFKWLFSAAGCFLLWTSSGISDPQVFSAAPSPALRWIGGSAAHRLFPPSETHFPSSPQQRSSETGERVREQHGGPVSGSRFGSAAWTILSV